MFCKKCGAQIEETSNFCPKCGESAMPEDVQKDDNPAMIFSIIGFVLSFFSSIAGLIVSIIAFKKYKQQENQQYKGLTIAGLAISTVGCAYYVASIVSSLLGTILYIIVFLISGLFMTAPLI